MTNTGSSQVQSQMGLDRDNIGWNYGDAMRPKRQGNYRHIAINVGRFSVSEQDGNKVVELCQLIK